MNLGRYLSYSFKNLMSDHPSLSLSSNQDIPEAPERQMTDKINKV